MVFPMRKPGEIAPEGISFSEAADAAGVSTATIRNWIKTGYLVEQGKGLIDRQSLDSFMNEVAGKEKLNLRANKSLKDNHDHEGLSALIRNQIKGAGWKEQSAAYETSLSDSYRNQEGIYYTPEDIVEDLLRGIEVNRNTAFLDPCCGSGNFLMGALRLGILPENVYGFDTDLNAIEIARKRIFEETGFTSDKIRPGNFMDEARILERQGLNFDLVFTNPPWGKKLKRKERERLAALYGSGSSRDTSSLFFFAALTVLGKDGRLGFLVQEALFNISSFQDTRLRLLDFEIDRIIEYGKPFKGLLSKAQAFIISRKAATDKSMVSCETAEGSHQREKTSFCKNPKQIFNFWLPSEEARVIDRVYSIPHSVLEGKASWALGIVTGNNKRFCRDEAGDGLIPVIRGSDITASGLKPSKTFIPDEFSLYQQVAPLSMYRAGEKLIYKFISSKLVFYHDTQQRFILNSANLLIPEDELGISMDKLCDLLNSDPMNWLFRSLFNTRKVLRGDIEQLPIHVDYFKSLEQLTEESYLEFLGLKRLEDGSFGLS